MRNSRVGNEKDAADNDRRCCKPFFRLILRRKRYQKVVTMAAKTGCHDGLAWKVETSFERYLIAQFMFDSYLCHVAAALHKAHYV